MSLDVSLILGNPIKKGGTGVFVRENGANVELTMEQVKEKWPDAVVDEYEYETEEVFSANITHNLGEMAQNAGIYEACWRPYMLHKDFQPGQEYSKEMEFEDSVTMYAKDIIPLLEKGYGDLLSRPEYFEQFNASNGWGLYENFLPWVKRYLDACKENPEAKIKVDR